MKNSVILVILLLAFTCAEAQFLKVGPKGGANLVKMDGKSFEDGFQLGYYAGGFVEIKLAKNWYLMSEVLWAQNEMTTTDDFNDIYQNLLSVSSISNIKLQSLSIPVSFNWKVANVLALSAGAQFSRNIEKGEGIMKSAEATFNDGNIAAMAGANFHFGKFRVHARYWWGLKEMNNIDGQDPWKQQSAQLGIGFVF